MVTCALTREPLRPLRVLGKPESLAGLVFVLDDVLEARKSTAWRKLHDVLKGFFTASEDFSRIFYQEIRHSAREE